MTLYCSFPLHIPKTLQTQKTDSIFVHRLLRYSMFTRYLGDTLVPLWLRILPILFREHIEIGITFKIWGPSRDSKSGERGEHARAIFLPLLC